MPRAQTPVLSPAPGTYFDNVSVTIAAEAGAQIRYTLNGSDPTASSTLYNGPFTLNATATVKARAFKSGLRDSLIANAYYKIVSSATPSASAEFLGANTTLGGSWKGTFGADGHIVIADSASVPTYATLVTAGHQQWIWEYNTSNPRAQQRASGASRIAPCWYSPTAFELDVKISAATPRRLTLYCLDWDNAARQQTVEIIDYDTGRILHTLPLTAFHTGAYLQYRLQGRVIIRLTRTQSHNAVLSGIFFDP